MSNSKSSEVSLGRLRRIRVLRESIVKVARILGGKNLNVTQAGSQAFVRYNTAGKPIRVNIPSIPDEASDELLDAIQGFLDHEIGHVLFSDYEYVKVAHEGKCAVLHNVLEDTYVERMMQMEFEGCSANLARMRKVFLDKYISPVIEKLQDREEPASEMEYWQVLVACAFRAEAGQMEFEDFMADKWALIPNFKRVISKYSKKIKNIISSAEACEIAMDIKADLLGRADEGSDDNAESGPGSSEKGTPPPSNDDTFISDEQQEGGNETSDSNDESQETAGESGSNSSNSQSSNSKPEGDESSSSEGESSQGNGDEPNDEKPDETDDDEGVGEESKAASEDEGSDEHKNNSDESKDQKSENTGNDSEQEEGGGSDGDNAEDSTDEQESEDSSPSDLDSEKGDELDQDEGDNSDQSEGSESDQEETPDEEGDESGQEETPDEEGDESDQEEGLGEEGDESDQEEGLGEEGDESDQEEDEVSNGESGEENQDSGPLPDQQDHKNNTTADEIDESTEAGGIPNVAPEDIAESLNEGEDFDDAMSKFVVDQVGRDVSGGGHYMPYTKQWDRVEKPAPLSRFDSSWITNIEDTVKEMVGPLARQLERAFKAANREHWLPGQKSGRLHGASLSRLLTNDMRVMRTREVTETKKVAVTLLIDCSGSMSGGKIELAAQAAWALAGVMAKIGLPCEILGFTTQEIPHEHNHLADEMSAEAGRDFDEFRQRYTRWDSLYMPIFKSFDEKFGLEQKRDLASLPYNNYMMRCNIDGESLEYAADRLRKRQEPGKVMIVLSDGRPAGSGDSNALNNHLKDTVKRLNKEGINTVGIGIGTDVVDKFYPKNVVLNDIEDLPNEVIGQLRQAIMQKA